MPYNATVYEVFIASPTDVQEERAYLEEEIYRWNRKNTSYTNIVLMPVMWEHDTYSSISGQEPQKEINDQIKDSADLVIGIFHARLGTPTDNADSGSVQEIREHLDADKPVMAFFSEADIPQSMFRNGFAQVNEVENFKKELSQIGIHTPYKDSEDFKRIIGDELTKITRKHSYFQQNTTELEDKSIEEQAQYNPFKLKFSQLFDKDVIIVDALEATTKNLLFVAAEGKGIITKFNGTNMYSGIEIDNKVIASTENNRGYVTALHDIEALLKYGLIQYRSDGGNSYSVTKKGYDIAEIIRVETNSF